MERFSLVSICLSKIPTDLPSQYPAVTQIIGQIISKIYFVGAIKKCNCERGPFKCMFITLIFL